MRYLVLSLGLLSLAAIPQAGKAEDLPEAETIQQWIRELDDDAFLVRERAMARLIDVGPAAIDPVASATLGENPEVAVRGVHILQRLALHDDDASAELALSALDVVSQSEFPVAASRASVVLAELEIHRRAIAMRELERLGAHVGRSQRRGGNPIILAVDALEIGEDWEGGEEGLRHLRWLSDTTTLTLNNSQANDTFLEYIANMRGLRWLRIRRAAITPDGLSHLKNLDQLLALHIDYTPLGAETVEHLAPMASLREVQLFGTGISPEATEQLRQVLPAAHIDVRRGSFLGIRGQDILEGCVLTHIEANSAAERGGLQVGDLITHIDDHEVSTAAKLTEILAMYAPGDTTTIACRRANEDVTSEIELGEWELRQQTTRLPQQMQMWIRNP